MDINEILDLLEELINSVDDLNELQDLMDRIDNLRNGNSNGNPPDPMELADLLSDILEFVMGKVPMGPYGRLVEAVLDFIRKAIDSNVRLALFILWDRYRRHRVTFSDQSHEKVVKLFTLDPLVSEWLRLKWLESQMGDGEGEGRGGDGHEDEETGSDSGGGVLIPVGPPWSAEYNDCCSTEDNGVKRGDQPPTITMGNPVWGTPILGGIARPFSIDFKATHPCGIKRRSMRVFMESQNNTWIELERGTRNFRSSTDDNGVTSMNVIGTKTVCVIIRVVSNCESSIREVHNYTAP